MSDEQQQRCKVYVEIDKNVENLRSEYALYVHRCFLFNWASFKVFKKKRRIDINVCFLDSKMLVETKLIRLLDFWSPLVFLGSY